MYAQMRLYRGWLKMIRRTGSALLLNVITVVMTIAAAVLVLLAWHVRFSAGAVSTPRPVVESEFVKDWRRYATGDYQFGSDSAAITIVEFADFQCPFCRRFAASIDTLLQSKPGSLRIVFHQFPLTDVHPLALSMAIASECASAQGRFKAFYDGVFLTKNHPLTDSSPNFAALANVPDGSRFQRCLNSSDAAAAVERDWKIGKTLGVIGTPTLLLNGHRYDGFLGYRQLDSLVEILTRASERRGS